MEVVVSSMEAKPELITLDLLGGCSSKDLDLGLNASSSFSCHAGSDLHLLDLNLLPQEGAKSAGAAPQQLAASQSVCTIEKVRRALERAAERESLGRAATEEEEEEQQARPRQKRPRKGREQADGSFSPSPSSSSSITTASVKRRAGGGGEEGTTTSDGCDSTAAAAGGTLVAAGCPGCLSYVLISKENPRCPRCEADVPPPATASAATGPGESAN